MRQTESGRNAWKKCGFGGGSLFYKEGCRRKKMYNGQEVGKSPCVPGLEEMLLWGEKCEV